MNLPFRRCSFYTTVSVLIFAGGLAAQVSNPQIQFVSTDPTGVACSNTKLQMRTPSGMFYTCQNGLMAAITGGSVSGSPLVTPVSVASGDTTTTIPYGAAITSGVQAWPSCKITSTGLGTMAWDHYVAGTTSMVITWVPNAGFTGACTAILGGAIGPAGAPGTNNGWTRTGTTLSPTNSGDSVLVGNTCPIGSPAGSVCAVAGQFWTKVSLPYTDAIFTANGTVVTKTLIALPAHAVVEGIRAKTSVAFAGTGITACNVVVGDATVTDLYVPAFDVFAAVSATNLYMDGGVIARTDSAVNVVATVTCNVAVGSGSATILTAGNLDLHVKWSVLP